MTKEMTIEPEVLRRSAEVMGKTLLEPSHATGEIIIVGQGKNICWNPIENDSQLVECIDRLVQHEGAIRPGVNMYEIDALALLSERAKQYSHASDTWKEAIVRAVAEVGKK